MKREIEFRGKNFETNEWVYGYYIKYGDYHYILEDLNIDETEECDNQDWIEINPSTLGQYIGLKDKNDKKVYEDDIIKVMDFNPKFITITYIEGAFCAIDKAVEENYPVEITLFYPSVGCRFEVAGNIFDDGEILSKIE